jgi:hypothetical protein
MVGVFIAFIHLSGSRFTSLLSNGTIDGVDQTAKLMLQGEGRALAKEQTKAPSKRVPRRTVQGARPTEAIEEQASALERSLAEQYAEIQQLRLLLARRSSKHDF